MLVVGGGARLLLLTSYSHSKSARIPAQWSLCDFNGMESRNGSGASTHRQYCLFLSGTVSGDRRLMMLCHGIISNTTLPRIFQDKLEVNQVIQIGKENGRL